MVTIGNNNNAQLAHFRNFWKSAGFVENTSIILSTMLSTMSFPTVYNCKIGYLGILSLYQYLNMPQQI